MPRLGEILIEKGALSTDGLRAGLDACRRNGGRLGTWLVRLGFINENVLLEALSKQTNCPPATAFDLATAPGDIKALISLVVAKRHLVVPFMRQGRNLDIAMINPNDLVLIDEIARMTGLVIRPHVATEAALAAALAISQPHANGLAPLPGPPRGTTREWRQFWRLESSGSELMKGLQGTPLAKPEIAAATFPSLAPLDTKVAPAPEFSSDDLAEALSTANHRDQVAKLVLGQLATPGSRVAMFSLQQNKVMGWAGHGLGMVVEDFYTLMLPLDRPSLFLNLSKGAEVHVGPLTGGEGNTLVVEALGLPYPKEAVVVPVRVRGKIAGFVWLDRGEESVASVAIPDVQEAARLTGLALEILVLRQKIKQSGT